MAAVSLKRSIAGYYTVNQVDLGTRLSCFGCEKKNGRTVGGTFYSFLDEVLSKTYKEDLERCYPPRPSPSVDNTLLDLNNSLYPTKAEFINC